MLLWKDVGNGILLDRPLPFKLHRVTDCYRVLFWNLIPHHKKSGRVPRNADLQLPPANTLQKNCVDDGDDLNTTVGISLPRWSVNAVIATALYDNICLMYLSDKDYHIH